VRRCVRPIALRLKLCSAYSCCAGHTCSLTQEIRHGNLARRIPGNIARVARVAILAKRRRAASRAATIGLRRAPTKVSWPHRAASIFDVAYSPTVCRLRAGATWSNHRAIRSDREMRRATPTHPAIHMLDRESRRWSRGSPHASTCGLYTHGRRARLSQ